ncbi:MAG: DNA polymerase elongation subunit, partial [Candidatus Aenigmarchaeota archaeon]|nr:DNA polymerase elongation subunit [Candidatus Aenigmarchaeota archaeon]
MILQVLDIDYFLNNNRPVIRIFGKTENGKAVCCLYDRLVPYFYARPKDGSFDALTAQLNALGLRYQIEEKFLPFGYQEFPSAVMKIWVSNPQDVPRFKEILEKGNNIYEADILFKYRFMTDFNVNGLQWIDIDCSKSYTKASKSPTFQINRIAPCEKKENAKMRYLSVDIECLLLDPNRAPDAKKDPIIIISFAFEPEFKGKKTLVLVGKPCIASDMVHSFPDEKAMLETFVKIFDEFDPDIVTGYNINNFDIPYLLERLQKHNIAQTFGRCDKPVFSKTFAASQEAVIPGRVVVDPYQLLKRDVNVRFYRYDLNTVAYAMLGEKKGDVAYRDIPSLWSGGEVELKKLIDYGRKDAELSLRILLEKKLLDKFFELSKISGVLLQDCLGGQSIRIENMLLREFRKRNILLPLKPTRQALDKRMNEKLKGATVLEPKKGLYSNYVLVLDFQSLYPSIIKKYNISPDAIVLGGNVDKFHESPTGAKFVHEDIYEGVFPYVINTLLKERLDTKKKMKTTSGEEKRILDAKQHALKILANSFYGYCGYVRARLYMLEIASA